MDLTDNATTPSIYGRRASGTLMLPSAYQGARFAPSQLCQIGAEESSHAYRTLHCQPLI
jgi:hypothetical protein